MRLFSKLYRLNLFVTIVIFVCSSCIYFLLVTYIVVDQFDSSLQMERVEIEKYVLQHSRLPQVIPIKDKVISFKRANAYEQSSLQTIAAYDTVGRDTAEFRKLHFSFQDDNQWYRATIGKSMEGTGHLIQVIIAITIGTILLILLVSSAINRVVLKNLWQPFYTGLRLMKDYEVGRKTGFIFPKSNTEEFEFMNDVLRQATGKADRDYLTLKEFTENASHEMQTPLAIIRSKMDLVIQDEQVSSGHGKNLQAMYQAIDKLTLLNQSLLLLTKIGNNQFSEMVPVNIADAIGAKLEQFDQLIQARDIKLITDIGDFTINMNKDMLDNLLNNLISNAIKHNRNGGSITITTIERRKLTVGNTGKRVPLDNKKLFSRFYNPGETSQTGLGLSIVKEICLTSGCSINYNYEEGSHYFIIEWE